MTIYNLSLIATIFYYEVADSQQAIDNLANCQKNLSEEDWHLCFVWTEEMTNNEILVTTSAFGGNAALYIMFRFWDVGRHDNQICRLMVQTHRLSNRVSNSYVPTTTDDGWVGALTYECHELYDEYTAAITKYNDGNLSAKDLQLHAKNLFDELSKTYSSLIKAYDLKRIRDDF